MKSPDWIFFSSRFGVESFFEQGISAKNVNWGAIGAATAKELSQHISDPIDFIGESNDTHDIARSFESICKGQTIWFPGSKKSKRIIQKHLDDSCEILDLPFYDTVKRPMKIDQCEVYVFTSPLNVASFFDCNELQSNAEIWAIGKTTEAALKVHTKQQVRLPEKSSVQEIIETLLK